MSRSTISTFELFALIPDAETARLYLESRLWPDGVTCPTCAGKERITTRKGGFYLNAANVARHTLDRLGSFIAAVDGQRLTYARLTA